MFDDALLMLRHVNNILAAREASPDWPTFCLKAPQVPKELDSARYTHVIARMLLPAFGRSVETDYRVLTVRRLSAAALAVRAYALDHDGKLPEKLEDLVPGYLPSVPSDALAAKQPIRYIADPGKP